MSAKKKGRKGGPVGRIAAQNRRARHDYHIEETLEAGIVLTGTEVKSVRAGRASINESYAAEQHGEMFLVNAHIPEYSHAPKAANHEPTRPRKLLLHRREISKLLGAIKQKGRTIVPLSIFFNPRGLAKVELALATGKHTYDKRQTIKDRDWGRQKARLMRDKG
jgi:SsrA-binding protein